jgi:hypothetical protein
VADPRKFTFINPDDLTTVPATKWVTERLIPAGEILMVCGAPKHLKTMWLTGALLSSASHLGHFFDYKTRRSKVLYVIGEGSDAFLGRIKAWQKIHDVPSFEGYLRVLKQMPNLVDPRPGALDDFKRAIEAEKFIPGVLALDTLNRTMPGANEDTPSLSLVFDRLAGLQEWLPGLTITVPHHTKKNELVFRGGQVIAGNADGMIYVERPDMQVMRANVTCDWFRNAANFAPFSFTCGLRPVLTDEGLQDFAAIDSIGPIGAATKGQQSYREKRNAVDEAKIEAYFLIKAKLSYTYNAWFRATCEKIKTKYERGLGDGTFSEVVKLLVRDGLVVDLGDHYQVVLRGEAPGGDGGFDASAQSTSNFRLPPLRGAEVPEAEVVASRIASEVAGSGSPESCNQENSVAQKAPDEAPYEWQKPPDLTPEEDARWAEAMHWADYATLRQMMANKTAKLDDDPYRSLREAEAQMAVERQAAAMDGEIQRTLIEEQERLLQREAKPRGRKA